MLLKSRHMLFAAGIVAVVMAFYIPGWAGTESVKHDQDGSLKPAAQKHVSVSELKKLRWIEGTWRGTGDVEAPFFERYRFENDSTLAVESFSDGTLSKVDDVTRFELKDGQFGNGGEGSRWAATELNDDSVTFEPVVKARNTFRWERQSKDIWKAVLTWPATEKGPAKQRVYKMERWSPPKQ